MGVEVTTTEKSLLVTQNPELKAGAIATRMPANADSVAFGLTKNIAKKDLDKLTWAVCPHLSDSDKISKYFMSSGLIIIAYGKCFCENCLDVVISQDNFSELTKSSIPMTDKIFQQNFVDPLININHSFSKSIGYSGVTEKSHKTWISCDHLVTESGLREVYLNSGQICIFENYFTCQHCFDNIATDSVVDRSYEGKSMTDAILQEKIIDPLYVVNRFSLESLNLFDLYGINVENGDKSSKD